MVDSDLIFLIMQAVEMTTMVQWFACNLLYELLLLRNARYVDENFCLCHVLRYTEMLLELYARTASFTNMAKKLEMPSWDL